MQSQLSLSPRYTLDDESPWLVGIDPVRRYWVRINGETDLTIAIPGLVVSSSAAFKEAIVSFRSLAVGKTLTLPTFTRKPLQIHHLADNLYAIAAAEQEAPVWHLFDRETIEAFLLTAHPDWQCAPQDVALGRDLIWQSWQQPSAA
jgi:hypothetical protein